MAYKQVLQFVRSLDGSWVVRKELPVVGFMHVGRVRWFGSRKRFVFCPDEDTLWDSSLLKEVYLFLLSKGRQRREAKK